MIQTTIWDLMQREAVCLLTGRSYAAISADSKAREMVPGGEWTILVGGHTMVLSPAQEVLEEQRYRHYSIDGQIYAGTFIGREENGNQAGSDLLDEGGDPALEDGTDRE